MARTIGAPGQYSTQVIEETKRSLDRVGIASKPLIADIGLAAACSASALRRIEYGLSN